MDNKRKDASRRPVPPPVPPAGNMRGNANSAKLFDQMAAPIPHVVTNKSRNMNEILQAPMPQAMPNNERRNTKRAGRVRNNVHRISRAEARRRRNRRRLAAVLIAVAVIIAGFTLSVTVLFKIEAFVLDGDSPYALDELTIAFAHPVGENIFAFDTAKTQAAIAKALPYIDTVTVRRRLPGTVVFKVTPAYEAYYIKQEQGYTVLSGKLKILRVSADKPTDIIEITGVVPKDATVGTQLTLDSTDKLTALNMLLAALQTEGLSVGTIDVTNELEMSIIYENRVKVTIGTQNDLEDKLAVAKTVLENHIGALERGTLDVSHQNENEYRNGVWRAGKF